ncbi:hypothetical protein [Thiolapillus sp.]
MKFGQIAPGQRFRWKGEIWLKTSPILACPEGQDKPRLVPRSAPVEIPEPPDATETDPAPGDRIGSVMAEFHQQLQARLNTLPVSPEQKKELARDLGLLIQQTAESLRRSLRT